MTKKEFNAYKLANMDRAVLDRRLSPWDFRVLWIFVSAAVWKTGVARRKQIDLAQSLGVHVRTVQRCLDRLVEFKYLEPVGQKPGGYISGYKVVNPEKAALVSSFEKGGTGVVFCNGQGGTPVQKGDTGVKNGGTPAVHVPFRTLDNPLADDRETEDRGPRQRADALGPLGELEPGLRELLQEDYRRLAMAELKARTADTIVLSVLTPGERDLIRRHCETAILKVSGASKLEFVVELAVEPPKLRSLQ